MITLTLGTNTYSTLESADAYHAAYGNTDWTDITDEELKKQALVLATQSIELNYGAKFMSYMASESQPLLFPRAQFYDNDGRTQTSYPTCLQNATAELALSQLNGLDLFPLASNAQNVKSQSLTVGGISISTANYRANEGESFEGFRKIDVLLRPILKQPTASWRIKA